MKSSILIAILAWSAPAHALVPEPQSAAAQKTVDALDTLRTEWEVARAGKDAQAVEAQRAELVKRADALVKKEPRGLLAVRTRIWLATSGVDRLRQDEHLGDLLGEDLASPALAELADWLRPNGRPDARAMLETLVADAQDRAVRGRAQWMLAEHAKHESARTAALRKGDVALDKFVGEFGQKRAAELREAGVENLDKAYVAALERVAKDYADVADARGRLLGARAEGALFEIRNLQIGMLAPDIEAEDVDGAEFKLSDYRGKVVVLDFWGHW